MKSVIFTVINWDNSTEADRLHNQLEEWKCRSDFSFNPIKTFLVAGSYSDPKYNPTNLELIQTYIDKQFFPDQPINYWKCGLMTGLHYCMLMKQSLDWDLIIYHHYSVLTSKKMDIILNNFSHQEKQICSPQSLTVNGSLIDTGMMIMKLGAVQKWILNSSSSFKFINNHRLSVEEEATVIFKNEWYNPFTNIVTMHKIEPNTDNTNILEFNSRFNLSTENFLKSDMVYCSKKHCSEYESREWKSKHPINVKGN